LLKQPQVQSMCIVGLICKVIVEVIPKKHMR
jgi:hypothetical protein